MKQVYEDKLNILLSELLNEHGVSSRGEVLGKGRRDVLVFHQGLRIVLEGSYERSDAEQDAKRRIEQLSADVALAVHYPRTFPQKLTEPQLKAAIAGTVLPVRIIVPHEISEPLYRLLLDKDFEAKALRDWHDVDLDRLVILIKEIAGFLITEDILRAAEDHVGELVDSFVEQLANHHHSAQIASNLYETLYRLYGFSIGDPKDIAEAIFAQATLAVILASVYYESIRYVHSLNSLDELAEEKGAQVGVQAGVSHILKVNYEPIFELVRDLLRAYPPLPAAFRQLVDLATAVAARKTLLRRDLAGKVYHRVVGDWGLRKGLATYFTQIPSAFLLLYLARPGQCRIVDFACGTGTLLVAAYSACSATHRLDLVKSGQELEPTEIDRRFHRSFLANCYAFDVLGYATQITALNLALHSPETPITEVSHVYTMPLGYREEDTSVSLGSLEFATGRLDQVFGQVIRQGTDKKHEHELTHLLELENFDLIVMNPPFSRTTGRGGKSGGGLFGFLGCKSSRDVVKANYKILKDEARTALVSIADKLLKDKPLHNLLSDPGLRMFKEVWQAGEGLIFLFLADSRLRKDGKLCFVLPKAMLCGVSWFLARTLLAAAYHVEYVIVSYEPGHYNFSESTSLSECMFVARKVGSHDDGEKTSFIILLRKPRTSLGSVALADKLVPHEDSEHFSDRDAARYEEEGGSCAIVKDVHRHQLIDWLDNWGRFAYLPHPRLLDSLEDILAGRICAGDLRIELPICRLDSILRSIGPDRKRFQDTFREADAWAPGTFPMLKGGGAELRTTLSISPNANVHPLKPHAHRVFEELAGNLLVPDRIRVDTAGVTAMVAGEKTIANIFYAVNLRNDNPVMAKALCIWLNSTWGLLTLLASRGETEGGFISLKQSQWRTLPVLDVGSLDVAQVESLSIVFDRLRSEEFQRIPRQFSAGSDAMRIRLRLDTAFLKCLGFTVAETDLSPIYKDISDGLGQWLGEIPS